MSTITGKVWVAKDYVMAYDIIIQNFWTSPIDPAENAKWVMAGVSEEFNRENAFTEQEFTFISAKHNFAGGGKSIEHVIAGLMGAGIKAVFAISFARLQFRNAINYGLPFVQCESLAEESVTGDLLSWDSENNTVTNARSGKTYSTASIPSFVSEIAQSGGLMPFIAEKIKNNTLHTLQ